MKYVFAVAVSTQSSLLTGLDQRRTSVTVILRIAKERLLLLKKPRKKELLMHLNVH
jgi:hypothetical protein